MATYDCEPTLTDSQVLEFCKSGFMLLDSVCRPKSTKRQRRMLTRTHYLSPLR